MLSFPALSLLLQAAHADLPADPGQTSILLTNPGPALAAMPVLVRLDAERVHPSALAAPETLAFALADGTPLPHDLDQIGPDALITWVRLPEVPSGETEFVLTYGDVLASPSPHEVWAGWAGVWHLDDTDESAAGIPTEPIGDASLAPDGSIGSGWAFGPGWLAVAPDAEDRFDFPDGFSGSLWFRSNQLVRWGALVAKGDGAWRLHQRSDSAFVALTLGEEGVGGPDYDLRAGAPTDDGAWHHLQLRVVDTPDGPLGSLWLDGLLSTTGVLLGIPTSNDPVAIGFNERFDDRAWDGWIDELHLTAALHSDAWIEADHLNQSDAWLRFCDSGLRQDADGDGDPCPTDPDDTDPLVFTPVVVEEGPSQLGLACATGPSWMVHLLRR